VALVNLICARVTSSMKFSRLSSDAKYSSSEVR
jgi:hypothetical protein